MLENNRTEIINKMIEELSKDHHLYLTDTIPFMVSESYEDRLIGEYLQLVIRHEKLVDFLITYKEDYMEPIYDIDPAILEEQLKIMEKYIEILEKRAENEGIELPEI